MVERDREDVGAERGGEKAASVELQLCRGADQIFARRQARAFDRESAPDRTKRTNALRVPLSALARSIIKEAIEHPARLKALKFVFFTTGETSISGFSKAKRRLDAESQSARAKRAAEHGTDPVAMCHWTVHDLRTTFNTLACDELGIDAHVADRILNHVATATTSKVMRIYNRPELFEPRKRALAAWAMFLEQRVVRSKPILLEVRIEEAAAVTQIN